VRETVCTKVSLLATDNHSGYRLLKDQYKHGVLTHEEASTSSALSTPTRLKASGRS
jgi:hypothetical protein